MIARCPLCLRERIVKHPSGLVFDHGLACPLLAAEDATKVADVDRLSERRVVGRASRIVRPATDAERTLLTACGVTLPAEATTTVEAITAGVLRRTWSGVDLEAPAPTDGESPTSEPATTDGGAS